MDAKDSATHSKFLKFEIDYINDPRGKELYDRAFDISIVQQTDISTIAKIAVLLWRLRIKEKLIEELRDDLLDAREQLDRARMMTKSYSGRV